MRYGPLAALAAVALLGYIPLSAGHVPPPRLLTAPSGTLSPAGEGRRLFLELNCYGCHGLYGAGGMGPNIRGEGGDAREAVLQGEDTGMRSFKGYVSTTDVNNLRAYLNSMGSPNEPKFLDWWNAVPRLQ